MSFLFERQGRQRGDSCGTSKVAAGIQIILTSKVTSQSLLTCLHLAEQDKSSSAELGQTPSTGKGHNFTCWVLQGGSGPSDLHTLPSSPASAPESARASRQPRAASCEARKRRLEQPAQSLGFKERLQSEIFFRMLQNGKVLYDST